MSAPGASPSPGNCYVRMLFGVLGTALVLVGMAATLLSVTTKQVPILGASPGLTMIGIGVVLLFACAFFDDGDITSGRFGFPSVTRRKSANGSSAPSRPDHPSPDEDWEDDYPASP